jgi:hypothetical protein
MPHILVTADKGEDAVMLCERVNVADFESEHFAAQLVERLGWAVGDADQVERCPDTRQFDATEISASTGAHDQNVGDPLSV